MMHVTATINITASSSISVYADRVANGCVCDMIRHTPERLYATIARRLVA